MVSEEDQTSTGGAIYVGDSPTDIEASTFSGNSAYQGGAVFVGKSVMGTGLLFALLLISLHIHINPLLYT